MVHKIAFLAALSALFTTPIQAAEICQSPGTAPENIALVKNFYEAFNTRSKPTLDKVLADDWVDVPMAPGQSPGREGMKSALDGFYAAFPDFHVKNEDIIADGDKVVVRSTITATQRGAFSGIAATGKPLEIMAIDIHQICHGRLTQTWHLENWLSALFQIGAMPPRS